MACGHADHTGANATKNHRDESLGMVRNGLRKTHACASHNTGSTSVASGSPGSEVASRCDSIELTDCPARASNAPPAALTGDGSRRPHRHGCPATGQGSSSDCMDEIGAM